MDIFQKFTSRKLLIAVLALGYFAYTGDSDKVFWIAGIYLGAQGVTDAAGARSNK